MPDHQARGRAVYDHNNDDPRPSGRRRRPVADWGVGEEIFDRLPGRRFARDDHAIPRGGAQDGRRTIVIDESPPAADRRTDTEEFASREDALRARKENEALWGGDEPFVERDEAARRDQALWGGDEPFVERDEAARGDESFARTGESSIGGHRGDVRGPDAVVHGGVAGRRTVKIGGRPGELRSGLDRPPRRRPPRTVGERLGARPDRVAAWAFMLGLLLILIAVATAQAAVIAPH